MSPAGVISTVACTLCRRFWSRFRGLLQFYAISSFGRNRLAAKPTFALCVARWWRRMAESVAMVSLKARMV